MNLKKKSRKKVKEIYHTKTTIIIKWVTVRRVKKKYIYKAQQ